MTALTVAEIDQLTLVLSLAFRVETLDKMLEDLEGLDGSEEYRLLSIREAVLTAKRLVELTDKEFN